MTSYQADVIAWTNEQAALIRMGKFDQLDSEHIAEEIEDVGKSEQRELASRMAVLLAHLLRWQLKWQYQPDRQSGIWSRTIKDQRKGVLARLKKTPSLKISISDSAWLDEVWSDAVAQVTSETGRDVFPEFSPWSMDDVLKDGWLPSQTL